MQTKFTHDQQAPCCVVEACRGHCARKRLHSAARQARRCHSSGCRAFRGVAGILAALSILYTSYRSFEASFSILSVAKIICRCGLARLPRLHLLAL